MPKARSPITTSRRPLRTGLRQHVGWRELLLALALFVGTLLLKPIVMAPSEKGPSSLPRPRVQSVPSAKGGAGGALSEKPRPAGPERRSAVFRDLPRLPSSPLVEDDSLDAIDGAPAAEAVAPLASEGGGRAGLSSREPAIFDLLRNSKGKPIPKEVRDLAEEVTKDATNAVSRTRAIYDWITSNIRYDAVEWENITGGAADYTHDHSPAAVLERGTTVCIGYAWLFDAMCESVGVEATYVIGDVRGYRGTSDDALVSAFRHAWNAVKTDDGNWELLDATWGAVQEGESPADAKPRADYYYATPASQFIYDHYPEESSWQLLEDPVPDEASFQNLPNLKPSFFQNGVQLGEPYTSALRARAGTDSALALSVPRGTRVAATLSLADGSQTTRVRTFTGRDGKTAVVVPAKGRGEYLLRIYSRKASSPAYECSADFAIRVE